MEQLSLGTTGIKQSTKRMHKREIHDEMKLVVPWGDSVAPIAPHAPATSAKVGHPPLAVETMLRIHFLQQWLGLSDPAMEESLHEMLLFQQFVGLEVGSNSLFIESVILRFLHLQEAYQRSPQILTTLNSSLSAKGLMLKSGTAVDSALIAAYISSKNSNGERNPEMHQTKKGNQCHFGKKADIGLDADSDLVHKVVGTAASVTVVTQTNALVHGEEANVFADAGYQGLAKREKSLRIDTDWDVPFLPGKLKTLGKATLMGCMLNEVEYVKASLRDTVQHPFRVLKHRFGLVKVRY